MCDQESSLLDMGFLDMVCKRPITSSLHHHSYQKNHSLTKQISKCHPKRQAKI